MWSIPGAGFAVALVLALVLAGCAQEGRLIETRLPALGAAWDVRFISRIESITANDTFYTVTANVRYKIPVQAANACEAGRGLVELRAEGPATSPVFILSPLARYNSDDECVENGSTPVDTAFTITVIGVQVVDSNVRQFRVETANGPLIFADFDSTIHSPVAATARFVVRVEDLATGTVIPGATVQIDKLTAGVPSLLGTGTTGPLGVYTLDAPCADSVGTESLPYRVTTTFSTRVNVISMQAFPARCQTLEHVVVRL